jgi:hypothetical protein
VQITFKVVSVTDNRRDLGERGICTLGAITRAGSSGCFFTYSPAAKLWQEGSAMNLKINASEIRFSVSKPSPGKLNTTKGGLLSLVAHGNAPPYTSAISSSAKRETLHAENIPTGWIPAIKHSALFSKRERRTKAGPDRVYQYLRLTLSSQVW